MAEIFNINFESGDLSEFDLGEGSYYDENTQCGYDNTIYDHNNKVVAKEYFRGTPQDMIEHQARLLNG